MDRYKLYRLVLALFLLVLFLSAADFSAAHGVPEDYLVSGSDALSARGGRFAPGIAELLPSLQDDQYVDVLILLREQADTERAAFLARQKLPGIQTQGRYKEIAHQAVISVLKETAKRTQKPLLSFLAKEAAGQGVDYYRSFYIVNIVHARVTAEVAYKLANRPEVEMILPNERVMLVDPETANDAGHLGGAGVEWNVDQIGATLVWNDYGLQGSGVVVGVIDTGVQWDHEALKEKWRGYNPADPADPDPLFNWFDAVNEEPLPYDDHKHGTHVTGTILGSDPMGINQIGVAPGASWIAVKALDSKGNGTAAQLLAAGEYMLAPYDPLDPEGSADPSKAPSIINNSWGGAVGLNEWYRLMVQSWVDAGIIAVFAAGNKGPGSETVLVPANYPESFAVAAVDASNVLAGFSSRGPGPYQGDLKPEISAPGVNIRSAVPGGGYESGWNGTSMAAPHVSGVVALLLESHPGLSVSQLEAIMLAAADQLTDSSYPVSPNYGYGYGLLNAYDAITFLQEGYGSVSAQVYTDTAGSGSGGVSAGYIPLAAEVSVLETGRRAGTDPDNGSFNLYHMAGESWTLIIESEGHLPTQLIFNLSDEEHLNLGPIILEKIVPLTIESNLADHESPQEVGTAVTWKVTAGGGVLPYEYAFYVYLDGVRVHMRWWNSQQTLTYVPLEAGSYQVRAFVRDAADKLVWADSSEFIIEGESLLPLTIESVNPDLLSPQEVGTAVTWTVTAGGGILPYEYAFYVYLDGVRVHTRWWNSQQTLPYVPLEAGNYHVRAFVRDQAETLIWQDSSTFIINNASAQLP